MREGEGKGERAGEEGSVVEVRVTRSANVWWLQWTCAMVITVLNVSSMKRPSNILSSGMLRPCFLEGWCVFYDV